MLMKAGSFARAAMARMGRVERRSTDGDTLRTRRLIVMLVAAPIAGYLTMPALAAILMITAWNMSEPHKWRGYMQTRLEDRALLLLTLVLTVLADLTVAIGVGVTIGLALRLRRQNADMEKDWTPRER